MEYKERDKLIVKAKKLREEGMTHRNIADQLGIGSEETIRCWLIPAVHKENIARAAKYHKENRRECNKRQREYYVAHRDTCNAYSRERYKNHAAEYKAQAKKWQQENPEMKREIQARYYIKHKVEKRKYRAEHKDAHNASNRLRKARIGEYDTISQEEYDAIFEQQKGLCIYCNRKMLTTGDPNHPSYKTQEHTFPVSRGGSHILGNLAYACRKCNSEKGTKTVSEWKPEFLSVAGNGICGKEQE